MIDVNERKCFLCNPLGHMAFQCPDKPARPAHSVAEAARQLVWAHLPLGDHILGAQRGDAAGVGRGATRRRAEQAGEHGGTATAALEESLELSLVGAEQRRLRAPRNRWGLACAMGYSHAPWATYTRHGLLTRAMGYSHAP